jgi:SAM-dependent methyltransferase
MPSGTMTIAASGPNAEQIEYWNQTAGPKWVALQARIDAQIRVFGEQAIARGAIATGERVLDVGCGCGDTTIAIGRRVGGAGAVTGVDVSTVMLERARAAARAAGLTHVRFEAADAQTHEFPPAGLDLVYSRFGVMFFSDPFAAFANLARALRPGGRLAFACWREIRENPWVLIPLAAAAEHIALPPPPAPGAPGPFAFGDGARVRDILGRAGFAEVVLAAVDEELTIGGQPDLDVAVDFLLDIGPAGAAIREAGSDARPIVARAVRAALAPHHTPAGVRLRGAAWIVTARRA